MRDSSPVYFVEIKSSFLPREGGISHSRPEIMVRHFIQAPAEKSRL